VDLTSYAELAVRLVNSAENGNGHDDSLSHPDALRALVADRSHLHGQISHNDMTALRQLRVELAGIFMAAAEGDEPAAADRLNALLIRHPVHPVISAHDNQRWHLHLSDGGSVADRYAAGAVFGLATIVTQFGADRLGICTLASCHGVFIDASTNRSRRYCSDHCASRANVTAFRGRQRTGAAGPASTAAG
jgi:predicted RNA-binding Zn ribbon-like protein